MNNKFFPYIWYLEYKKIKEISFNEYIPYFELSLDGFNIGKKAHINLPSLNIYFKYGLNENLAKIYIKILAKIRYELIISKLSIYNENEKYLISKWKYKARYIKDKLYIFFSCIKDNFESYMIYRKDRQFFIILDYKKTAYIERLINDIIEEFLPIGFECRYFFNNFLFLDIIEFSEQERWISI